MKEVINEDIIVKPYYIKIIKYINKYTPKNFEALPTGFFFVLKSLFLKY
jgi:hypothetical protein